MLRMNHSCCPNVVWSYLETDPMIKEVRALKNIVKDEELCPNYIDSFEVSYTIHVLGSSTLLYLKF